MAQSVSGQIKRVQVLDRKWTRLWQALAVAACLATGCAPQPAVSDVTISCQGDDALAKALQNTNVLSRYQLHGQFVDHGGDLEILPMPDALQHVADGKLIANLGDNEVVLADQAFLHRDREAGERFDAALTDALFYLGNHHADGNNPNLHAHFILDVHVEFSDADLAAHGDVIDNDLALRCRARFKGYFDPNATR